MYIKKIMIFSLCVRNDFFLRIPFFGISAFSAERFSSMNKSSISEWYTVLYIISSQSSLGERAFCIDWIPIRFECSRCARTRIAQSHPPHSRIVRNRAFEESALARFDARTMFRSLLKRCKSILAPSSWTAVVVGLSEKLTFRAFLV